MDTYEKTATGLSPEIAFFYRTKEEAAAKKDTRDWYIDKRPKSESFAEVKLGADYFTVKSLGRFFPRP